MYVRGSDKNIEYKRDLNGFFRGIIMDDADPSKFYRCKIFIPEIHGAVDLVEGEETVKYYISPDKIGSLKPNVHQRLLEILPWAEQASSLFGELSLSHYNASRQEQTGGTLNSANRDTPPSDKQGALYPAQKIPLMSGGSPGDGNALNPTGAASVYLPAQNDPSAHGIHGVPSVGAHVWVFFDRGDINCPVYIAGCPPASETLRVYQDNQYPEGYSSWSGTDGGVQNTPPEPKDAVPFRSDGEFFREDLPPNLQPLYEDYVRYGEEFGVDPRFLASISILETGGGTSKAFREGNNAMGISNKIGVNYYRNNPAARGGTIRSMARSLAGAPGTAGNYGNAVTINQVGPIYAPSGALNDKKGTNSGWSRNVSNIMRRDFGIESPEALIVIDRT